MNSAQTMKNTAPEDDDLDQATVRELIVQLALVEDEHRKATDPGQIAAVARREQVIVAALHRHGLTFKGPGSPNAAGPKAFPRRADDMVPQK
jgi:hypothetical protein